MKHLITFLFIGIFWVISNGFSQINQDEVNQSELEYAYFLGQRAAIYNQIIIKEISTGVWVWKESPWEDGSPVINDTIFVQ